MGNPPGCVAADACATLPNDGLDLVATDIAGDPFIDCTKNCLGINRPVVIRTYKDAYATLDVSSGNLCLSGVARFDGFVEVDISFGYYDTAAYGLDGFEFTVEGNDVPALVQFGYYFFGDSINARCVPLDPPIGHHVVPFDTVYQVCSTDGDVGTTARTGLSNIAILVLANGPEETFDFCVSALAAVR